MLLGRAHAECTHEPARRFDPHPARRQGGQSFGAFLARGITLYLIGDANDGTGKGLSGGRIVVRPSLDFRGEAVRNTIVGNTVDVRRHHRQGALLRRGRRTLRGAAVGCDGRSSRAPATTAANT